MKIMITFVIMTFFEIFLLRNISEFPSEDSNPQPSDRRRDALVALKVLSSSPAWELGYFSE